MTPIVKDNRKTEKLAPTACDPAMANFATQLMQSSDLPSSIITRMALDRLFNSDLQNDVLVVHYETDNVLSERIPHCLLDVERAHRLDQYCERFSVSRAQAVRDAYSRLMHTATPISLAVPSIRKEQV